MITSKRQLSLNHWVWDINREQFGGQRGVPDSQLCSGENLNCLYCAGLEQIRLTNVPEKGNGGTAAGKHAPLSGHKRNGQSRLADINLESTSGHLLLPNHIPGIRVQLLYEKKGFQKKANKGLQSIFTD